MTLITSVRTKGRHSLVGLALEIEPPSLIGAGDGSLSPLDGYIVLAFDGLAVENKERNGLVGFPAVQIMFDV